MTGAERAARECVKVVADALIEIGHDRDKVECEEMESAYLEFVPIVERAIEESRGQADQLLPFLRLICDLAKWEGPDAAPNRMHEIWQKVTTAIANIEWENYDRANR